jgi:hypothetical protein
LIVDDDSRGAHATFKDDLMLLAGPGGDGTWARELAKLLREEQQEKDELQKQRIAKVHDWQQTVEDAHITDFSSSIAP